MEGLEGSQRRNFWGNIPEGEEEYYDSQGIESRKGWYTSPSTGVSLFTRSWLPKSNYRDGGVPRGLVFMVHGYGNDISWTFQSTPIFLAQNGFACFALDLPGHGRSHGLTAFVPNVDAVAHDCLSYFNSIINQHHHHHHSLPCFLFGESMGGAICLLIHLITTETHASCTWNGAVLVAPMCKISDNIRPRWPIPQILTLLARFLPTLPIVPTADLVEKSVKVEEKRTLAASNPLRYGGKPRLGTVLELLRVTDDLSSRLSDVTLPFIVLHGSADVVTDPDVSRALHAEARSKDKTIRIYDGMMHSLLFGETDDNVALVRKDILTWLEDRSDSHPHLPPL